MPVGATISVEVRAKVPAEVAEGSYPMFLRAVDEGDPELLTDGQPVSVRVPKAAPAPAFPVVPVLIAVLVVLLLGGGAVWWFGFRSSAPVVAAPVNVVAPVVSGEARVGEMLTATPGQWEGNPTFGFSWIGCDAMANNCAPIPGANQATYQLTAANLGGIVRAEVTATNAGGSASVASNNVGPVAPGTVKVPNVKGETFVTATKMLTDLGLTISATNVATAKACAKVITQNPATGKVAETGTQVQVTVTTPVTCLSFTTKPTIGPVKPMAPRTPQPTPTPERR